MSPITTVTAAFTEAFGYAPALVARGPGRVNLIGEHTDYNEGFVLPFALEQAAHSAVAPRTDHRVRLVSDLDGVLVEADLDAVLAREVPSGWVGYPLGVAWALAQQDAAPAGFDLALTSDVPVGAGLSSSAAVESATALPLDRLWGSALGRLDLAKVGQRAENVVVGAPTGIMDQCASLFGAAGMAVFLDCRTLQVEQVPLDLTGAGLAVLVMDTHVHHAHATGGYGERRAQCETAARVLGVPSLRDVGADELEAARDRLDDVVYRRARHVVTENERVLQTVATLREAGPRAIGTLLDASHASMRDDFEISVPELDLAVETARDAGALGARMTGGGFGGSAIALVDAEHLPGVADAVRDAFARAGYAEPGLFTVHPAEGAALVAGEEN